MSDFQQALNLLSAIINEGHSEIKCVYQDVPGSCYMPRHQITPNSDPCLKFLKDAGYIKFSHRVKGVGNPPGVFFQQPDNKYTNVYKITQRGFDAVKRNHEGPKYEADRNDYRMPDGSSIPFIGGLYGRANRFPALYR